MQKNAKNATFFYKERKRMQRTQCSFIKNVKERKECNVLLKRMQKNIRECAFFYKERKRMQRTQCSFIKHAKEHKRTHVLLKRTLARPCLPTPTDKNVLYP